jgi:hypothetical protein
VNRHVTATVTMLVLIGLLVLGAVLGWRTLFAELPGGDVTAEEPSPTCTMEQVEAGGKVRAGQVQVSVFNGGTRSGLAGDTLDALTKRGFVSGDLGNAPSDIDVRRVQVWSMEEDDPRARLVARQFGPKVKVQFADEDLGTGVDVIVGDRFRALAKAPRALTVDEDVEFCAPEPVEPTE